MKRKGDTGRRNGTYIFAYKRADTYKHASHTTVILTHRLLTEPTLLHTIAFTYKNTYAFTQTLLHRDSFTHKHFYTQTRLHANPFTHNPFYTQTLLHTTLLHRNTFTHQDAFTHPFARKHFYTQTLLHTDAFTQRDFYTETQKIGLQMYLYAKEKEMLQMISRKKIEMICEDSKLKPDEVHRKSFICKHFYTHTLLLYAHTHTHAFIHKCFHKRTRTQTRTSIRQANTRTQ